jgi:hypothetical protein
VVQDELATLVFVPKTAEQIEEHKCGIVIEIKRHERSRPPSRNWSTGRSAGSRSLSPGQTRIHRKNRVFSLLHGLRPDTTAPHRIPSGALNTHRFASCVAPAMVWIAGQVR